MAQRYPRSRPRVRSVLAGLAIVAGALTIAACAPGAAPDVGERSSRRLSAGCTAPGDTTPPERLVIDGRERTLIVNAPTDGAAPHDLVIAFHGRTNDAARARAYFELDEAMPGALIVYPHALPAGPGSYAWRDPHDPVEAQRDVALVAAIVEAMGAARCVDLDRVFVVGHSLGAYFANDLACHHGTLVRAAASVAGGLQGEGCRGGTAALLIHHPGDTLVPIEEGERARDAFRSVNGYGALPATPATQPALSALGCERYGGDDALHPVVWCPRDEPEAAGATNPHGWPDGTGAAIAGFFADLR